MKIRIYILCCVAIAFLGSACERKSDYDKEKRIQEPLIEASTYRTLNSPQIDMSNYKRDKDGYISLFDGKTLLGWREYNRSQIPDCWIVEDGTIKINDLEDRPTVNSGGGDIIFTRKFKNFELSVDWKVRDGGNSGIFYLVQEIPGLPIEASGLQCQIIDNQSLDDTTADSVDYRASSLCDILPVTLENTKPVGQWNNVRIRVYNGTVQHIQNGIKVLEYRLWTPQWQEILRQSRFSQSKWPVAYNLLSRCGGQEKEGYIGLQDSGGGVWYKNIKIKILE